MTPRILISCGAQSPRAYVEALEAAGCEALGLHLPDPDPGWDGLVLAGGGDMAPCLFGEENTASRYLDPDRDAAELALLDAFAAWGKPVLGICRGLQVVNVWAGGTLLQDLGERGAGHQQEHGDLVHPVDAVPGTALAQLYGPRFSCASAHHQAVGRLGKRLQITATAPDGVIEGLSHKTLPILTVQFHPERMHAPETADGGILFRYFASLFA